MPPGNRRLLAPNLPVGRQGPHGLPQLVPSCDVLLRRNGNLATEAETPLPTLGTQDDCPAERRSAHRGATVKADPAFVAHGCRPRRVANDLRFSGVIRA